MPSINYLLYASTLKCALKNTRILCARSMAKIAISQYSGKPQGKKKRKSNKNVTRGGCEADPPLVSIIHHCFNSKGTKLGR